MLLLLILTHRQEECRHAGIWVLAIAGKKKWLDFAAHVAFNVNAQEPAVDATLTVLTSLEAAAILQGWAIVVDLRVLEECAENLVDYARCIENK